LDDDVIDDDDPNLTGADPWDSDVTYTDETKNNPLRNSDEENPHLVMGDGVINDSPLDNSKEEPDPDSVLLRRPE
jgi:hypothetical protein